MSQIIELRNIVKEYGLGDERVRVLKGVSLEVAAGEFAAIVGPSGSGKSTLMNMIGLLDLPDEGSYKLDGIAAEKLKDYELAEVRNRKLGFIFQQFNLLPRLSALENVELPLIYAGFGKKERRERAAEMLKALGMEHRIHHKPSELSGGQQQRVAIARALVVKPALLLADEPTGALDSRTGAEVMELMKELNEKGNTVVLITHDQHIADNAKRVISILDGEIVDDRRDGGNHVPFQSPAVKEGASG